jgi:hypothetical protein
METESLGGYVVQQQTHAMMAAAAREREQQEAAALFTHRVVTRNRITAAAILFGDHRVGELDAETVEAFGMETNARAVRNTARSRQHVVDSRRSEGDFDFERMVRELEFALANLVMFYVKNGRVNLIAKRPGTRDRFFLLHVLLDAPKQEWLLESFNRIGRKRVITEYRKGSQWSLTPAARRALLAGHSAFD